MARSSQTSMLSGFKFIFCGLLCLATLSACGDTSPWWHKIPGWGGYWWTRGQPAGTLQLLGRAQDSLDEALVAYSSTRQDIANSVKGLQSTLDELLQVQSKQQRTQLLQRAEVQFSEFEGKLSIGSTAPYGELLGTLRRLIDQSYDDVQVAAEDYSAALRLFTSRTKKFLANELQMPAPVMS